MPKIFDNASPPYPSSKDLELALYPRCVHLIVSLASLEPEIRCWSITPKKADLLDMSVHQ